jgi:hypothetical protein
MTIVRLRRSSHVPEQHRGRDCHARGERGAREGGNLESLNERFPGCVQELVRERRGELVSRCDCTAERVAALSAGAARWSTVRSTE